MNEDELNEFKKIVDKYDQDIEIFAGKRRKKQMVMKDVKNKTFLEILAKWCENSKQGLVCGIYGCVEPVNVRCKFCKGGYCVEHKNVHFHHTDGIILRND